MVKRTQQPARDSKQEAKDVNKSKNGLFASCSFSSLGLDPKLSDQLQGSVFLSLSNLFMLNELDPIH